MASLEKYSPRALFFNLEGGIFAVSDINCIIKNTLKKCRSNISDSIDETFDKFCKGQISESEFWRTIQVSDNGMPRKLILETIENSFDDDFLNLISGFQGKKIGIYGNLPKEWIENILESSGLAPLIHISILSSDLEETFPSEKAFDLIKNAIPNSIIIDSNEKNMIIAKEKGLTVFYVIRKPIEKCTCHPDLFIPKIIQMEDLIK